MTATPPGRKLRFMRCFERLVPVGLVLIGCGGQARTGAASDETNHGGTAGAGTAGSSAGGAPATIARIDDERAEGRPAVPDPIQAAVFWGSDTSGWHIGNWFVTSSDRLRDVGVSEIVPPRDGSTEARRVTGEGHAAGVVLWLQLDHPANRAVDLSAYSGLTFWARLESASGQLVVALNDGARGSGLLDGKWTLPSRAFAVEPDWREFTLPFDTFPLDDLSITSIEFFVGDGGEGFDLWIDDLAFLCSSACP